MNPVKITYIVCSTIETLIILAAAIYLSNWWSVFLIIILFAGGHAFKKRMDLWTGEIE